MYAEGAPRLDPALLELGIPVLGICYGMQALVLTLGGRVEGAEVGEFGRSQLTVSEPGACWPARRPSRPAGCRTATRSSRRRPASRALASSTESPVAALEDVERGIYGIQFHPEVVHTPYGQQILTTFLEDICGCDAHLEPGVDRRGAGRADPRPGRRRPGDLRALGRRRLLGGRAARAPRDRRPAHVRVRRPRADAQERGRAGHLRVPRPLQGPARRGRRRGPLPRAPRRAVASPRPSARRSAPSSSASSRRRRASSRTRASSSRARSTPT